MNSNRSPITNITAGVNLVFTYAAGETASRFLAALRDEQKIYGKRCPTCRRVLVPARSFCPRCFAETSEWIEVGPGGTLVAFTPLPSSGGEAGADSPFPMGEGLGTRALALIRLDGADTNLLHLLEGREPQAWQIGMRLEAVFAAERVGSIRDILYFRSTQESK